MTDDQRKKAESLFHVVLAMPQEEREPFLAVTCPEDPIVCKQVLLLCSNHDLGKRLVEQIDLSDPDAITTKAFFSLRQGDMIGRYRIVELLGRGGMGEVYLAEDPSLKRKVAIKVLPPDLASDPELIERLQREARAASALNHPNILTIHEFIHNKGLHCIVSEYVQGRSLRESIGQLTESEVLNYGHQICEALAAAHTAGIVHRDIKPENVMVRPDGYVKVLDFGLAKVAPLEETGGSSIQQRLAQGTATVPGLLMGTVSYMSPEQVRGEPVDQRTDIWSLGVVLYEMLTGKRPFEGATVSDVIAAILEREPSPAGLLKPGLDPKLRKAVAKALEKNMKRRWQHVSDFQAELQRLKRGPARSQHSTLSVAMKAFYIVAFCLSGFGIYRYLSSPKLPDFSNIVFTPLTNSGEVDDYVAISPDGKLAAYGLLQHPYRMMVKQLATGSEVTLVEGADPFYGDAVFSPNGDYVYYRHINGSASDLYAVPALGGSISHIAANVTSAVTFSPDGKRIAFVRLRSNGFNEIVISNADGTNSQVVFTPQSGIEIASSPSWSQELNLICFAVDNKKNGMMAIEVITPSGTLVKSFSYAAAVPRVQWLPKAGGMLFLMIDVLHMGRSEFWFQPYPEGQRMRVRSDFNGYSSLSVTADGSTFVTNPSRMDSAIYVADVPPHIEHKINWSMKPVSPEHSGFRRSRWMTDGRLLEQDYMGRLFMMQADGGGRRRVLPQGPELYWVTSCGPEDTIVASRFEEEAKPTIWKIKVDSGEMKQITRNSPDRGDVATSCDANGKWIVYLSITADGTYKTMRVSSQGGDPVLLLSGSHYFSPPAISPDGKLFAQILPDDPSQAVIVKLNLYSVKDGDLKGSFRWQADDPAHRRMDFPRWTADNRLTFRGCVDMHCQIYWQPFESGRPVMQLTDVDASQDLASFDWSHDGQKLVVTLRKTNDTDAVVFTGIRLGK